MTRTVNTAPTEAQDQIKFAVWLNKMGIRFTASANGGKRNYLEAVKFKRMGVSAGFPDIFIPLPIPPYSLNEKGYHGLLIELKRIKGGKPSVEQIKWLKFLREQGYYAEIAYGLEEAKQIVLDYLKLTPLAA